MPRPTPSPRRRSPDTSASGCQAVRSSSSRPSERLHRRGAPAGALTQPSAPEDQLDTDIAATLLAELVAIDSQNPELVPGAAGEAAIAEWCVGWLRAHGVDAWLDEVAPGRPNAVARVGRGERVLTLCAHLDTVALEGMESPGLDARVADGRLYGRGAYDMKCGVAAIMLAMAALARRELSGTVMAALVCDEEYASIGAEDFVRRYRSDACILTEPSEERLIVAHKGFVWVEAVTRGVAAHGSRWEQGVSAVARMGRVITVLDAYDRDVLRERVHPLLGPASMHCAMVSGGEGWSTYAPACVLRIERRTLPGETPPQVLDELRNVLAGAGEQIELREVLSRPPLEQVPGSALATCVADAALAVTGTRPEVAGVAYWMDAAIFAAAGADTVDYGPAGAGAHGAVEWVDLASVVRCAGVLEEAAARFLG